MTIRLKDKVMLITGGGAGIGQATAFLCAGEGAKVVVMEISEAGCIETERKFHEQGREGLFLQADVRRESDWRRVMKVVEQQYGRLDILFSNAGSNIRKPVTEVTEEEWDAIVNLNLKSVFFGAKHAIPLMIRSGGGCILNMASTFGLIGYPIVPIYAATKGGVIALTRQIAVDYAQRNIRVNCICPGPTLTPRVRGYVEQGLISSEENLGPVLLRRWAKPEEIAAAVLFMVSDEASYMTGSVLVVDGGQTAD